MAEYINREILIKRLEVSPLFLNMKPSGSFIRDGVIDIINKQSVADVVKVVRCKDCEYYDGFDCFRLDLQLPDPDNFCSWAERRSK